MSATLENPVTRQTITDLLTSDGFQVVHASGDEFHSPCPQCGGRDRLSSFPNKPNSDGRYRGGRFVCRRCNWHGDAAAYLMERRGLSFSLACAELGLDPGPAPSGRAPLSVVKSSSWTPAAPQSAPGDAWQEQATEFLKSCQSALQANERAMAWLLEKRGLSAETVTAAGLGINAKDQWLDRSAWGLPEEVNEKTGKPKKVWLPAGLVIPWHNADGKLIRLRIRRNDPGDGARYIVATGSCMAPMILWNEQRAVVVVESELDALLIHQDARDLVGTVALGSAQAKLDEGLHKRMMGAESVLVALDSDEAGGKASWTFWRQYPGFKRWPCVQGKDPCEQMQNGLPVRLWIEAAMVADETAPVAVDIDTAEGPRTITEDGVYLGWPTPELTNLADLILTFIADQSGPVAETDIIAAVGGDPALARNTFYRLCVDGIVKAVAGGLYKIPEWPPAAPDLPPSCPLKTGGALPAGCRFEAKLLRRMMTEGALPLPSGRCPLRTACKVGRENGVKC